MNRHVVVPSVGIIILAYVILIQSQKITELENKVALIEAVMVRVGLTERIPTSEDAGSPGAALPQ